MGKGQRLPADRQARLRQVNLPAADKPASDEFS